MTTPLASETISFSKASTWSIRILTFAFLAQMLLSSNLWFPYDRSYPTIPLLYFLDFNLGSVITNLLSGCFLGSFAYAGFSLKWRKQALGIGLGCLSLLILEDINRFQAWVYIYTALLGLITWNLWLKQSHKLLIGLQFIMAMVYFWTGAQKLNIQFITDVYPWLVKIFEATKYLKEYPTLGYGVGLFEMLIGVLLLIPKTKKTGVLFGSLLHLGILTLLIKDNWNSVVYPWNVAMIALLFTLFWKREDSETTAFEYKKVRPNLFIVALFGILPFFDFFQLIPHCLALGMYSGTSMECDLIISNDEKENCVPLKIHDKLLSRSQEESILSLDDWGGANLNIPPFASDRVYRAVAKEFCTCSNKHKGSVEFYYPERWEDKDRHVVLTCEELLNAE
jgi:hypothetical protein